MNFIKTVFFLLLFLNLGFNLNSQTKADSLRQIWIDDNSDDSTRFQSIFRFYELYSYSKPDSSLELANYHYELGLEKRNITEQIKAKNERGNILNGKNQLEEALLEFQTALNIARTNQDKYHEALIASNIGNTYNYQGDYIQAIRNYRLAIDIFKKLNSDKESVRILINLAGVYLNIEYYDIALEQYNKALDLLNTEDSKSELIGVIYLNIGIIYFESQKLRESERYFRNALGLFIQNNNKVFEAICYNFLGDLHIEYNMPKEAESFLIKSKEISILLNNEHSLNESLLLLAEMKLSKNVDAARELGNSILSRINFSEDKNFRKSLYLLLYKCFKEKKNSEKALEMFEISQLYNDSLQNERNKLVVLRELAKHDFEIQLRDNQLQNEKDQNQLKLDQQRKIIIIVGVFIILIAFFLFFFRVEKLKNEQMKNDLLNKISLLKNSPSQPNLANLDSFELKKGNLEEAIGRSLNQTDWNVLNILLENPVLSNKEIGDLAFKSTEGIGSSLKRMYDYFEIGKTKYMKISLLMKAIKLSKA